MTGEARNQFELDSPAAPIVFISPGLQADVRLCVFKQEFHVHSIILKLHSAYFRKFLDSADKAKVPTSALFRYEYVTVVDTDGEWALEGAAKVCYTSWLF